MRELGVQTVWAGGWVGWSPASLLSCLSLAVLCERWLLLACVCTLWGLGVLWGSCCHPSAAPPFSTSSHDSLPGSSCPLLLQWLSFTHSLLLLAGPSEPSPAEAGYLMRSCRGSGAGAFSPTPSGLCSDSARGRPTCSGSLGWLGRGEGRGSHSWAAPSGRLVLISAIPSWPLLHQMLLHLFALCREGRVSPLEEGRVPCLSQGCLDALWVGRPQGGCWEGWGALSPILLLTPHHGSFVTCWKGR